MDRPVTVQLHVHRERGMVRLRPVKAGAQILTDVHIVCETDAVESVHVPCGNFKRANTFLARNTKTIVGLPSRVTLRTSPGFRCSSSCNLTWENDDVSSQQPSCLVWESELVFRRFLRWHTPLKRGASAPASSTVATVARMVASGGTCFSGNVFHNSCSFLAL